MCSYHKPVLLKESIEGLKVKPDGIYVDVTFGGGGHAREILKKIETGKLIAFDQDIESEANITDDHRFILIHANFRFFKNFLRFHGIEKIDGLIADLGVSSHQFDTGRRGFSYRFDSVLDMRMNTGKKLTAGVLLNTYSEKQLFDVFVKYGEVENPKQLVNTIVLSRNDTKIETTSQFLNVIRSCYPKHIENKYLSKVFQALRIEVNKEIDVLKELLTSSSDVLKKEGRLVVITYHSLEDRLVKNFIKQGEFEGEAEKDMYGNTTVPFLAVNRKVIIPNETEINENNRARSAKLRIAEKN